MGCCSPEYRKVVNEKEKEINKNEKDSFPLIGKIIAIGIVIGAIILAFIL